MTKQVSKTYHTAYKALHARNLDELYEIEKRDWIQKHPDATQQEYQRAMRMIATRVGI